MSAATASVFDLINQLAIPYNTIGYYLNDEGKKIPIGERNTYTVEQLKEFKNCSWKHEKGFDIPQTMKGSHVYRCFSLYLKYTDNVYCVDVDEADIDHVEKFGLFVESPWVRGNNKGIHVFVRIEGMPTEFSNPINIFNRDIKNMSVDLIGFKKPEGQGVWERVDKEVFNYREDGLYPIYQWEEIKGYFDESKMSKDKKTVGRPRKVEASSEASTSTPEYGNDKLNLIHRVFKSLASKRYDDYKLWFDVGCALYHEFGNEKGLELFHLFSSKSSKYTGDLDLVWQNICRHNYPLTMGSLIHWAREDDPEFVANDEEDYFKVKSHLYSFDGLNSIYYKAIYERNDKYVYDLIEYLFPRYFVSDNKTLFFFNRFGIYEREADFSLTKIKNSIIKHMEHLAFKVAEFKDLGGDDARIKERKTKIKAFIDYLGSTRQGANLKAKIIEQAAIQNFSEMMDETNKDLIGFTNGVFDLKTKTFRKGRPDDYVSITTGYDYYEETFEKKNRMMEILCSLWENQSQAEYFLNMLAFTLSGNKTANQMIAIHSGLGGNGKSLVFDLLRKTIGDYFGIMSSTYFTTYDKDSTRPNSELALMKGRRICVVSEPGSNCKLQVNKLKMLSGNEPITTRQLRENAITYYPQFNIHFLTNDIPQLSAVDGGIERRLKIINYPFVFRPESELIEGNDKIKLRDDNLPEELEGLKMAFFQILVQYFNVKFQDTEEVKNEVSQFMRDNNPVREWCLSHYENSHNEKDKILLKDLYESFKEEYPDFVITEINFSRRIQEIGFNAKKTNKGKMILSIIPKRKIDNEDEDDDQSLNSSSSTTEIRSYEEDD